MDKIKMSKVFAVILLFLFLQGCYVGPEPVYYDQNYGEPPPIEFNGPPHVIVIPDTYYVYAVPDINFDLYFWDGWWWRSWNNRWYRSRYYDHDWYYYNAVPSFYFDFFVGWRNCYRNHNWYGHNWNYERIPHHKLKQHWKSWQDDRHWEKRGTWGVENYQPRSQQQKQGLIQQKQNEYYKRQPQKEQPDQRYNPPLRHQPEIDQPDKRFQDKNPQREKPVQKFQQGQSGREKQINPPQKPQVGQRPEVQHTGEKIHSEKPREEQSNHGQREFYPEQKESKLQFERRPAYDHER